MGSGKGKTRRLRTARPQAVTETVAEKDKIMFQQEKWDEFIKDGGIWDEKFYDYYLEQPPEQFNDKDYEQLMAELFADAVAVGALPLPEPYTCEDFEFVTNEAYDGGLYSGPHNVLCIRLAAERHPTQLTVPAIRWGKDITMSGLEIVHTLERTADEVSWLIRAKDGERNAKTLASNAFSTEDRRRR